jgi:hypothetical protein
MQRIAFSINKVVADLARDDEQRLAALAAALDDAATIDDEELRAAVTLARKRAERMLEARNVG